MRQRKKKKSTTEKCAKTFHPFTVLPSDQRLSHIGNPNYKLIIASTIQTKSSHLNTDLSAALHLQPQIQGWILSPAITMPPSSTRFRKSMRSFSAPEPSCRETFCS